ncbi:MAG: Fe-S cluster assembly transcriptional regulator IscR [Gammaproteobacteria bacterium]|nr:MAG: Fe-S cluster assembly transcriptional regulator IscR [Gammaproteobacteria bacterium]
MKLTTKGRYAVTAMLDLSLHSVNNPITLSDISSRQDLSLSYLEQLFSRLRRNGLVMSTRGPGGGYQLGRDPEQIKVAEVILAVNESLDATGCQGKRSCQQGSICLAHNLWLGLSDTIYEYLNNITLAEVISQQEIREIAYKQDAPVSQEPSDEDLQSRPGAGNIPSEVTV